MDGTKKKEGRKEGRKETVDGCRRYVQRQESMDGTKKEEAREGKGREGKAREGKGGTASKSMKESMDNAMPCYLPMYSSGRIFQYETISQ